MRSGPSVRVACLKLKNKMKKEVLKLIGMGRARAAVNCHHSPRVPHLYSQVCEFTLHMFRSTADIEGRCRSPDLAIDLALSPAGASSVVRGGGRTRGGAGWGRHGLQPGPAGRAARRLAEGVGLLHQRRSAAVRFQASDRTLCRIHVHNRLIVIFSPANSGRNAQR